MSEPPIIAYRRLVVSLTRELTPQNVEEIAFVRLSGKEDSTKYSVGKQGASALCLMITLERLGEFSFQNPCKLIEILKDVKRTDLVKNVEQYIQKQSRSRTPKPPIKQRTRAIRSEEHRELEHVYDIILRTSVRLEEHASQYRDILKREGLGVTGEDASKLLREGESIVRTLLSVFPEAMQKFDNQSPPRSFSSESSDGSSSLDDTSPLSCEQYYTL